MSVGIVRRRPAAATHRAGKRSPLVCDRFYMASAESGVSPESREPP